MIYKFAIAISIILLSTKGFAQYEMINDERVINNIPNYWHGEQQFPEFFLFENSREVFISYRIRNDRWKTLQLFESLSSIIEELTISGASMDHEETNLTSDLLFLRWKLELHHSWGRGGFGSNEEFLQVIDLTNDTIVLEFTPYNNSSGSESSQVSEGRMSSSEYHCEYRVDFRLSHDSIIVQSVDTLNSYSHYWEGPEEGEEGEEIESSGPSSDCGSKLQEGIYLFNGHKYLKIENQ